MTAALPQSNSSCPSLSLSASGLSRNDRAGRLGEAFYQGLFEGTGELVLGAAVRSAQRRYAAEGVDLFLLDAYNLIGDPATVLPAP